MTRDVLDENLERLLTRAYAPVRPRPAFAEALRRTLRAEIATRKASPARALARWPRYAAAASLLLCVGVAYVLLRPRATASPDAILARGETAVRVLPHAGWRPLDEREREHGIEYAPPGIEIATAADSSARVWIESEARVDVRAASVARVADVEPAAAMGSPARVDLDSGALAIERYGGGEILVHTEHGEIALERGALSVSFDTPQPGSSAECVRVRLASGVAWALQGGGRTLLGLDADVFLCNGRVWSPASPFAPSPTERAPIAPVAPTSPAEPTGASGAVPALTGRVRAAAGETLPPKIELFLLRTVRLPKVAEAERVSFARGASEVEATFAITGADDGSYTVFVQAPGFAVWQASAIEIADGQARAPLDVVLERGGSVVGRVVDAASGRPIEGAAVLAELDVPAQLLPFVLDPSEAGWTACARTGADGRFELAHLARGRHILRASNAGFAATWSAPFDVETGAAATVELELGTGGVVFGQAARQDGSPFAGAHIVASIVTSDDRSRRLHYGYAVADDLGRYSIPDMPPGGFVVLNTADVDPVTGSTPIVQAQIEAGKRVEVNLPGDTRGTRLFGMLRTHDGQPIEGIDVTVSSDEGAGWRAVRSDAQGAYSFAGLPPAHYAVVIGREFGKNLVLVAELDLPDAAEYAFDVVVGSSSLHGVVHRAESRAALADAVVILELEGAGGFDFAGRTFSDGAGRFTFEWLQPGRYRVSAYPTRGRLAPARSDVIVLADGAPVPEIALALGVGAALEIRLRDAAGQPIANAPIELVDVSGEVVQHTPQDVTDGRGRLTVSGMSLGRWIVRARVAGRTVEQQVELAAGEMRRVELTLTP